MSAVAVILAVCSLALGCLQYVLNVRAARRPVRIQTQRTVRDPLSGQRSVETYEHAYPQPPGPMPWPIIGNLVTLGKYEVPFIGLTALAKQYGDCYALTLGTTRCLVVNNLELIREVLNQNGKFFGGRPDFLRFHTLFGGDRSNCEYTNIYTATMTNSKTTTTNVQVEIYAGWHRPVSHTHTHTTAQHACAYNTFKCGCLVASSSDNASTLSKRADTSII